MTRDERIAELQAELTRISKEVGPLLDAQRREAAEALVGKFFARPRVDDTRYLAEIMRAAGLPRTTTEYARCTGISDHRSLHNVGMRTFERERQLNLAKAARAVERAYRRTLVGVGARPEGGRA